ncbi:hypothetical protein ACX9R5_07970 [Rathayibacter sp. CAU 1779]
MSQGIRAAAAALTIGGIVLFAAAFTGPSAMAAPGANVIDALTSTTNADSGNGWAIDPANPGGGGIEQLVEGPATPPSGRGSLQLTTPTSADRAQVYTNPAGAVPSAWDTLLGASFSTFTFAASDAGSSLPVMRFAGWQAGTTQGTFTTLSFGQPGNGTAASGQWQTWTLTDDSIVFQSNAGDGGFCVQATPCTFAAFAARYPTGVWGQVQVGLGSGAAPGASGYADAVSVTHGSTAYSYDFEVPAVENSTASVQQGSVSSTGGQAAVTLTASPLAAGPVVFTITATLPDGTQQTTEQSVAAGETATVDLDVPFGATSVSVTAQSVSIANGTVSFAAPAADTTTPPPSPAEASQELAATGSSLPPLWPAVLLVSVGASLLTASTARRYRVGRHNG